MGEITYKKNDLSKSEEELRETINKYEQIRHDQEMNKKEIEELKEELVGKDVEIELWKGGLLENGGKDKEKEGNKGTDYERMNSMDTMAAEVKKMKEEMGRISVELD